MGALSLAVQYACHEERLPSRSQIRRWLSAARERPAQVTVRFVGVAEGRRLNRDFRGKDYATNVLSFVYESSPVVMGDLVLCVPVAEKEARQQGKTPRQHWAHLLVHGMLHLQGYDHETGEADAEAMEAREAQILTRFRIPDPYA